MEINRPSSNSTTQKLKFNSSGKSITIKMLILFVMLLILQIPVIMIRGLIDERQNLGYQSEGEIVSSWGSSPFFTQAKVEVDSEILLFITIATSMFCLRNVKWYGENEQ